MPAHSETRILPYAAEELFDLVLDIDHYPEFLPWCLSACITKQRKGELEADVTVGLGPFRESFSSRVKFKKPRMIEVEYLKGPMEHLINRWTFRDLRENQCEVDFHVDFSMKARFLDALVSQFFDRAFVKMVNAFEVRAIKIYGHKKIKSH